MSCENFGISAFRYFWRSKTTKKTTRGNEGHREERIKHRLEEEEMNGY